MARLQDVISRGLSTAKPLATDVAAGTLYYSTDLSTTERSNGTAWETYNDVLVIRKQVVLVVDGGGSVITTGQKFYISLPTAGTWKKWRILADVSGSIVIDVWKNVFASYPPTVANTIVASAPPTLSAAISAENTTLTGWTTTFAAGDVLGFNVNSVTTVKKVSLSLEFE